MNRNVVSTDDAARPGGPYSQGIRAGDFVFVSSCDGREPKTGQRPAGAEAQTRQTLSNIRAIVNEAGTSLENVVKVTVFLGSWNDFEPMNRVYGEFFPKDQPARTTVQTALRADALVAMDVIALLPGK
jgi:2-iminobutanoate/2-iminopropanoate deaminase